jgi:outer membrane receptor protein involved in Fe transport
LRYAYIGYQTKVFNNVDVDADRTTKINVVLEPEAIAGEEIVVTASRPIVEFNQTSVISTVGKEDIKVLPVQSLNEIVNLQAGVIDGHFRGGRLGEVQYQVDGVTVNNPYDNKSTLQLDRSVLEEVQVISGTFDAKYGQAMSGVVNAVLKSGSNKFEWNGEAYFGDYFTLDNERYPENNFFDPTDIMNFQVTFGGPLPLPKTTYFVNGRRFLSDSWLFGQRQFLPTDNNDLENGIVYPGGDGETIAMQIREEWNGQFKITNQSFSNIQISYQAIIVDLVQSRYNHSFRLNPEGINEQQTFSITHGLDWTHTISPEFYYKLSARQNYFDYSDYKYADVYDPRYLEAGEPQSLPNYEYGAVIQGVDLGRFIQETNAGILKVDFTWQAHHSHLVESGLEGQISEMKFGSPGFLRSTIVEGTAVLLPQEGTEPEDPKVETYYPRQFSAYLQDRLEWGDLVLRAGLRLEYFDAVATIPSDLQNPANSLAPPVPQSKPKDTSVKIALAPRLGFSFPLSSTSSLYFSYGHFYQMPGLGNLYNNSNYLVLDELQEGGIEYGVLGNPDLEPELTIQYEFGLKQALSAQIGAELSIFYKDIRDLLGVEFVSTYAAADYARFTNVDFGSVYGFTCRLTQRSVGAVSTSLDYTLQFASGNSSDPQETANRAKAGEDPRPRVIPFNWDQRQTLNATAIYSKPQNFSISTILRFGSGQPYTPEIGSGYGADLETNSARKDPYFLVDFRAEKYLVTRAVNLGFFLRIFNVFNTHFVNGFVFATTGSPDYTQFPEVNQAALIDPSRFYEPRRFEIGITLSSK